MEFLRLPNAAGALFLAALINGRSQEHGPAVHPERFGIQVVDAASRRGVPLVELKTVNDIRAVTDNDGWVAFEEPGMMDREVFWEISGPGIEREKDGFGYRGVRAMTKPGSSIRVKVKNVNIATRLGRLTGQGRYRDSALLGLPVSQPQMMGPGVTGQDSVQATPFAGRIFWLWGDTSQARYPLGNFHTTSAWTARDAHPEKGLVFDYLTDPADPQRLRQTMPSTAPGVVWMFGLMATTDADGSEHLLCGYTRQKGLTPPDEKGIAEYDPGAGHFRMAATVSKDEKWRAPAGHALRVTEPGGDYFYFCVPYAHTRVRATLAAMRDPAAYETLRYDAAAGDWQWQTAAAPTTQEDEKKLLADKQMPAEKARYQLRSAADGAEVSLHTASIQWNAWLKRYVLTGVAMGGKDSPSVLGELWYAASDSIQGPWKQAVKIASHPRYSFYNPIHHGFFDREEGRVIYIEGTYTKEFSGNPLPTMRYDYNQLMYRLDLGDPRLKPAH